MLVPSQAHISRMLDLPLEGDRLPSRSPVQSTCRLFSVLAVKEGDVRRWGLVLPDSGRRSGKLGSAKSQSVYRMADAWLMAQQVFKDPEKSRRFLTRAHPLLRGRIPIELAIAGDDGLLAVRGLLGRLYFGAAA
jgi:uncharacterized protein (DUF2384 family)